MSYPFDPDVRRQIADRLYDLLPALYRIRDLPEGRLTPLKTAAPAGEEDLYKLLFILAAPLAELRENIDELHADLFIDKSADWVLPYLARMVGTRLIFPDAASNRKDVRGTVGWRRRKGTPAMLEEMGSDLSAQMVVTQEGWKRILLAQDLNLLRPERTIAEVRPALLAEQATGPLDRGSHAVDPRRISPHTGRYHPRHVTHWTHPTQLFPLHEGTALDRTARDGMGAPLDGDLRYTFHPLGAEQALRLRRAAPDDRFPPTDRVPAMHFAAAPGDYFDQEGTSNARFTVRLDGLPGAVATPVQDPRLPSSIPASMSLAAAETAVLLLVHQSERLTNSVDVGLYAVPLVGAGADTPDTGGAKIRGAFRITPSGGALLGTGTDPVATATFVAMLKLTPVAAPAAFFPGATLELASAAIDAALATSDPDLAATGFLRGALVVDVPATWIYGARWLYLAADGSVFEGQSPAAFQAGTGADLPLVAAGGGALSLPGDALTLGPGPAWPPLPATADPARWQAMPSAAGRGPVIVRAPLALQRTGPDSYVDAGAGVACALVFAARSGLQVEPFLRLDWMGSDPTSATTFQVLASTGLPIATTAAIQNRFRTIAQLVDDEGDTVEMLVRFESASAAIVLPPCEVAYTSADGDVVLVHLPTLETGPNPFAAWPPSLGRTSPAVSVSLDGSTYAMGTLQVERFAHGAVAPIRDAASHRRRRVRQRSLCQWNHEDAMTKHAPTPPGWLDIDPLHGLFALAVTEPPPPFTTSAVEALPLPSPVTVDYQEGYSHHVGARPDAREPLLDAQQPAPTRLVVGAGRFHRGALTSDHTLPRYPTVSAALAAIAADALAEEHEVIQIEDSATYHEAALTWPANIDALTLQAAEFERPVLVLSAAWTAGPMPSYTTLVLRGLVLQDETFGIDFPRVNDLHIQFCTAAAAAALWTFLPATTGETAITIVRSITGRIACDGRPHLTLRDSVVDAAQGKAIDAPEAMLEMERVTVVANPDDLLPSGVAVDVRVMEVSEVIFDNLVVARDRFHGCIRYSRAEPAAPPPAVLAGSQLPRRHRVVDAVRDENGITVQVIRPAFVTRDRNDPAHLRLADTCPRSITRGAEDGSEMGAFHGVRLTQRTDALVRRLIEFTPAGLATGLIRLD